MSFVNEIKAFYLCSDNFVSASRRRDTVLRLDLLKLILDLFWGSVASISLEKKQGSAVLEGIFVACAPVRAPGWPSQWNVRLLFSGL